VGEKFRGNSLAEVMTVVAEEKRIERKLIHFEGFTLDVGKRGLFRGDERLHLTSKPLETLIFLVENRGRVVEKRELFDAVWKETFVTNDVLVQAIREIRRALDDNKDDPRFVQTVPRRGYRFIGDVAFQLPFVRPETGERAPLTVVPKSVPEKALSFSRIFLALAGVAIIAAFAWLVWSENSESPRSAEKAPLSSTFVTQSLKHLPTGEFPVGKPAFSPDGKLVLYVGSSRETSGFGDIFVMSASGGESMRITSNSSPSGDLPVFTADASHVVFSRPRGGEESSRVLDLYIAPTSGGETRLYMPESSGAGFSPDGKWVAYTKHLHAQKLLLLSPTSDLSQYSEIAVDGYTPRWSPDGRWIAYTTSNPNGGPGDLWIVDPGTLSEPRNLTQELQQIYGLTWSADSRSLIFSSKRTGPNLLWRVALENRLIEPISTGIGDAAAPSASTDGKTLLFHNALVTKDLMLFDGGPNTEPRQITHGEYHHWVKLSPSGNSVASVMQRPDFGEHLYVTDLKTMQQLSVGDTPAHHPCWLDEENVAYLLRDATTPADTKVEVVNIGTKVTSLLTVFSGLAEWLAIHPDRRRVAVVSTTGDGTQKIVLRNLDGTDDQVLVEGGRYTVLRWLPNGSALTWSGPSQASSPASDGIWKYDLVTRGVQQIVSDGYGPAWNPSGKILYYSRGREFSGLWQFDTVRERKSLIRTWTEVTDFDLVGKRLLFAQGSGRGQIYSITLDH
jgi:DNA-binding winged helix-turn-helix (wHTH) protein/Tol biopolymer transport system component